ncbi:MAG: hypothetical protein JXA89_10600 [Anaerolineae bacterium]|nr:hypothetical protein [Anaerolineae bacterium]
MDRQVASSSLEQSDRDQADCASVDINVHDLRSGILHTVEYSDIFDYPLTAQEIHRYLVGIQASPEQVRAFLRDNQWIPRHLIHKDGYFVLRGREAIVEIRRRRAAVSVKLWPKAVRYGRWIASLPFVRMVAVTGTLAVNNADPGADIDYLIVTEPHRLWLVRTLVIALVYAARLEALELCPNYLMTLDTLDQFDRSLFTAHELAQMVPLYGFTIYQKILKLNDWARCFFPNAFEDAHIQTQRYPPMPAAGLKRALEAALAGRWGDWWEKRIQRTKIPLLIAQARAYGSQSATFTPQLCKGHMDDHDRKITELHQSRVGQTDHSP